MNGSRMLWPSLVKTRMRSAHSSGGFWPPCALRSACCMLGGYGFVITDLVQNTHSLPVRSFTLLASE